MHYLYSAGSMFRLPINLVQYIVIFLEEESVFKEEFCIFSPTLCNTHALKGKSIGCLYIIYLSASEKSTTIATQYFSNNVSLNITNNVRRKTFLLLRFYNNIYFINHPKIVIF